MSVTPGKTAKAKADLRKIKATVPTKSQDNKKLVEQLKKNFNNIGGSLFVPTGFEGKSLTELGKIMEEAYPGFTESDDIFKGELKQIVNRIADSDYTEEEIQKVLDDWNRECELQKANEPNPENATLNSQDEIDAVIDEIVDECDSPIDPPVVVPFTNEELLNALCNIQAEPKANKPDDVTDANPNLNIALADDKADNSKHTIKELDDLIGALKGPTCQVVIGRTSATVTEIIGKVGDTVTCNTNILRTSDGLVPAGVKYGTIKEIGVKVGDIIKGVDLFRIKTRISDDLVTNVLTESKNQIVKVKAYIQLKELIPLREKDWYFAEIEHSFFKNRFDAYASYFNKFQPKVNARVKAKNDLDKHKAYLSKVENYINSKFGANRLISINTTAAVKTEITRLIKIRKETLSKIKNKINEINSLTAQISNIRSGQPFFAQTSNDVIPSITAGGSYISPNLKRAHLTGVLSTVGAYYKNPLTRKTVVRTFQPESTVVVVEKAWQLAKNTQTQIEFFSNEIGLNKKYAGMIKSTNFSSYNPSFQRLSIETGSGDDAWTKAKVRSGSKEEQIKGRYHQIRVDFFNFVDNSTDEQKGEESWGLIAKAKDESIEVETDLALQKVVTDMAWSAKQYGHVAINQDQVYLNPKNRSTYNQFKKASDDSESKYIAAKAKVDEIRALIEQTKLDLENLPTSLDNTLKAQCKVYQNCGTGRRNNEDCLLCEWPQMVIDDGSGNDTVNNANATNEDLNFRGNPKGLDESPPITDIVWWKKFCGLATLVNLLPLYWPVGLLIPTPATLVKMPLPVAWIPLVVIPTPAALIVIGIAQAGILPCPFVFVLNPHPTISLGPVTADSCFLAGAIRPLQKIKDSPGSAILPAAPIVNIAGNVIDIDPTITQNIPFLKDDFPPYERLSLSNVLLLVFMTKWCAAGKKGEGFFENP